MGPDLCDRSRWQRDRAQCRACVNRDHEGASRKHEGHEDKARGGQTDAPIRTLVWFRGKDLRVADHAPLREAVAAGDVIPLFVLDPYFFAKARARATPHRIQFLLESLRELESSI